MQKNRPKHLDLSKISLPIGAKVSILHRVSGVFLFLALPLLLYLLRGSLSSADTFETYQSIVNFPLSKLVLLVLLWAFLHHFCAGIRFLLFDLHVGQALPQARASAKAVLVVSLGLTVILGVVLW